MLAADDMLDLLSQTDSNEAYQNYNDDDDFGMVLEVCKDSNLTSRKLRCSDGEEIVFSFDK